MRQHTQSPTPRFPKDTYSYINNHTRINKYISKIRVASHVLQASTNLLNRDGVIRRLRGYPQTHIQVWDAGRLVAGIPVYVSIFAGNLKTCIINVRQRAALECEKSNTSREIHLSKMARRENWRSGKRNIAGWWNDCARQSIDQVSRLLAHLTRSLLRHKKKITQMIRRDQPISENQPSQFANQSSDKLNKRN